MDGKGRARDNIFTERLWRSLKYEEVYLNEYKNPRQARRRINEYFDFYNHKRLHQSLEYRTPAEVYGIEMVRRPWQPGPTRGQLWVPTGRLRKTCTLMFPSHSHSTTCGAMAVKASLRRLWRWRKKKKNLGGSPKNMLFLLVIYKVTPYGTTVCVLIILKICLDNGVHHTKGTSQAYWPSPSVVSGLYWS